tara:strand:+ start:788 stop:1321 length:534 start_codon:yes stop_codon:yes gene_type:complete
MASELHVDAIKHSGGTSALTIDSSGNVHKAGMVVQVVKSGNFTSAHVSGTSSSYASMGSDFALAITPKFNNSLILIEAMLNPYTAGSNNSGTYNISKDGGSSFIAAHDTNGFGIVPTHGTASGTYSHFIISCSDTVSSTSTVTYQIYFRSDNTNNNITFYGNHANMSNHITLIEVAQ